MLFCTWQEWAGQWCSLERWSVQLKPDVCLAPWVHQTIQVLRNRGITRGCRRILAVQAHTCPSPAAQKGGKSDRWQDLVWNPWPLMCKNPRILAPSPFYASATTTLPVSGHRVSGRLPQGGTLFAFPRASELYTILQASYLARFAKMSRAAAV